jgi:cytochrome c oxidase cbb3-type subunit 3
MSAPTKDELRDHEYDGIQEFDNRLPNWWLYTLYGSILFAVFYWLGFHTWDVWDLPMESYEAEMAAAAEAQLAAMADQEVTDEALQLMSTVPAAVAAGRATFEQFCVACHLADGSGIVGPNLTDDYWLHGGKPLQIHATITDGVPDKGMAAWGNQLGPRRVQEVVAYVLTLKGLNRPGKEPQGELETD